MAGVWCPDNKQYILSGHETPSTEFSNATEIHCTADFSCIRKFHDCVKRSMASSMALCTTETIQMGSPQQLEST